MTSRTWQFDVMRRLRYEVVMTESVLEIANPSLALAARFDEPPSQRVVVTDPIVWTHYGPAMVAYAGSAGIDCEVVQLLPGEENKNIAQVLAVVDACAASPLLRRRTAVIAFGGGTVLDIAGLA